MSLISSNMRLGNAVITLSIDKSKLNQGFNEAKGKIASFVKFVHAHHRKLLAGMGLATGATGFAAAAGSQFVDAYNQSLLSMMRLRTLTGELSDRALGFTSQLAKEMRVTSKEARDAYSRFFAMGRGLEMSAEESEKFATALSSMAYDFASFHGMDTSEGIDRMVSAMSGSAEVMDQFGVNLREAQIEIELANMGIHTNAQNASELQKAYARLAIIQKTLQRQGITGQSGKVLATWTGQVRRLGTAWENIKIAVGERLAPAFSRLVETISKLIERLTSGIESGMYDQTFRFLDGIVEVFRQISGILEDMIYLGQKLQKIIDAIKAGFGPLSFGNTGEITIGSQYGTYSLAAKLGKYMGEEVRAAFMSPINRMMDLLLNQNAQKQPSPGDYLLPGNGLTATFNRYTGQEAARTGPQAKADKQLDEMKKQTKHLGNIEKNTAQQMQPGILAFVA